MSWGKPFPDLSGGKGTWSKLASGFCAQRNTLRATGKEAPKRPPSEWKMRWAWPGRRHGRGLEAEVGVARNELRAWSGREVGVVWKGRRAWPGRRHGRGLDRERGGQCCAKDAPE